MYSNNRDINIFNIKKKRIKIKDITVIPRMDSPTRSHVNKGAKLWNVNVADALNNNNESKWKEKYITRDKNHPTILPYRIKKKEKEKEERNHPPHNSHYNFLMTCIHTKADSLSLDRAQTVIIITVRNVMYHLRRATLREMVPMLMLGRWRWLVGLFSKGPLPSSWGTRTRIKIERERRERLDFDEGRHEEEFDLRIGSLKWMYCARKHCDALWNDCRGIRS